MIPLTACLEQGKVVKDGLAVVAHKESRIQSWAWSPVTPEEFQWVQWDAETDPTSDQFQFKVQFT